MTSRLLISLSLLALAWQTIRAQSADDFFHGGAQSYLTNNAQNALKQAEAGLKLYPTDVKLQKLYELLKRQQQNESQSQQGQQQQQQQNQQNQQSQPEKEQAQQKQQQPQDKNEEQQKQEQAHNREEEKNNDESNPRETQGGEMTPLQAERLLDAQKEDEKMLPLRPVGSPQQRPIRDW